VSYDLSPFAGPIVIVIDHKTKNVGLVDDRYSREVEFLINTVYLFFFAQNVY
jgi:hypothetical protein